MEGVKMMDGTKGLRPYFVSTFGFSLAALVLGFQPAANQGGVVFGTTSPHANLRSSSALPQSAVPLILTVTSPNGSESWVSGSTHDLTWDISSPVSTGAFNLWLIDGDGNWLDTVGVAVMAEAGKTQYNASWYVNVPVRSDYKLTVYYRPDANVWGGWTANDISDADFAVTGGSLGLSVTSPNGSETWVSGSPHDLTWEISSPATQGAFSLWLVDGAGNWLDTVGTVLAEAGKMQYSASWSVNAPVRSEYKLTVYYRPDANVWGGWTANDISDNAFAVTPMFVAAGGGRGPLSTTIVTSYTFVDPVPTVNNQTMRVMLRTTAGGSQVAVKLTNRFSSVALPVGAAHVAIQSMGGTIVSGSDRTLTFSGAGGVTIPANAEVWSDPASLAVTHG